MADWEKKHIVEAFRFELGKVEHHHVREGVIENLNHVDHDLAVRVAEGVGVRPPEKAATQNHGRSSPALSQADTAHSVATRKIAILAADGVRADDVAEARRALTEKGAVCEVLGPRDGALSDTGGGTVKVDRALATVGSVLYDAVLVPGGEQSIRALAAEGKAVYFVAEAFKHYKAVGALGDGVVLLEAARVPSSDLGVITTAGTADREFVEAFAEAVAAHRHFGRDTTPIPA
jgi:catalase